MQLHNQQKKIAQSNKRFKVIRAGRKGGKTLYEIESLCFKATASITKLPIVQKEFNTGRKVIYIAPTQDQARRIVWEALKTRLSGIATPNEQMLSMKVPNEDGLITTIYVGGYENRENYRGLTDVIHITFDEVDTLKNFFLSWREIFRPMFLDTAGTADFIGTPKKENPNLKRLEKEAEGKPDWGVYHFTSKDNPFLPVSELEQIELEYKDDPTAYKQEILAEYVENSGSLFKYECLVDSFTNTITKTNNKYLLIDVAENVDKTVFSYWEGLEEYNREEYSNMTSDSVIEKVKEATARDRIPYSHVAVDGIGIGSSVASSPRLAGIVNYKGSYSPVKTDPDITKINTPVYLLSSYKNLRSQCMFKLAEYINNHKIASRVTGEFREKIIEELALYQDASTGDGKSMVTKKEEVKALLGHSPDHSDTWQMRMYFELKETHSSTQSPEITERQQEIFRRNEYNFASDSNSSK